MPSMGSVSSVVGCRRGRHTPQEYISRVRVGHWDRGSATRRHATIPGPWGPFHVAATERGVVAVGWLTTDEDFEADVARRTSARRRDRHRGCGCRRGRHADDDPRRAPAAAHRRARGAPGRRAGRRATTSRSISRTGRPGTGTCSARSRTCRGARRSSYGEIARRIGAPRAARAVGGAVGRNPIGLLIPCHRVIAGDGTIGGYGGDGWGSREDRLEIKRELLAREGVTVHAREPDRLSPADRPGNDQLGGFDEAA